MDHQHRYFKAGRAIGMNELAKRIVAVAYVLPQSHERSVRKAVELALQDLGLTAPLAAWKIGGEQ